MSRHAGQGVAQRLCRVDPVRLAVLLGGHAEHQPVQHVHLVGVAVGGRVLAQRRAVVLQRQRHARALQPCGIALGDGMAGRHLAVSRAAHPVAEGAVDLDLEGRADPCGVAVDHQLCGVGAALPPGDGGDGGNCRILGIKGRHEILGAGRLKEAPGPLVIVVRVAAAAGCGHRRAVQVVEGIAAVLVLANGGPCW